jgi:hypothetical protein
LLLRLGYENFSELAPSAQIITIAATTITISANAFSYSQGPIPGSGEPGATDADWFDPALYEGDVTGTLWNEGKWNSTKTTFKITSRTGNVLTVDTNMTGSTAATNLGLGERTLLSFNVYSGANTARQNSYAHTADNSSPPDINGAVLKEFR